MGPEMVVQSRMGGKGWPGLIQEIRRGVPGVELTLTPSVGMCEASCDDQGWRGTSG